MRQNSEINTFVGHLFRHHAGKMAAVLSRRFGVANIDLIEDAIQDAMMTAMKRWPFSGTPDNPAAWLTQVARNKVVDQLRRRSKSVTIDDHSYDTPAKNNPLPQFTGEIGEDQLRLVFACCHPTISPDSQVALTLKIVCGFGISEIARAFLSNEDAVAKLITRAKNNLRGGKVPFEIPAGSDLTQRLAAVLKVLYLMFNEGYSPTAGSEVIRRDLCSEAMRFAEYLSRHPATSLPQTRALTALFCFHAARIDARIGNDGEMLLLADQDRSAWDRELIARGLDHLLASARGTDLSGYHIEAEIASIHATANSIETTDWHRIVECYDLLQTRSYSPIAELNRIIAIGRINGPAAALEMLEAIADDGKLDSYYLFYAAKAHFLAAVGRIADAAAAYALAGALSQNESSRQLIESKMADLEKLENKHAF